MDVILVFMKKSATGKLKQCYYIKVLQFIVLIYKKQHYIWLSFR